LITFSIRVEAQGRQAVLVLVLQQNEVPIGINQRLLELYGEGSLHMHTVCR